MEPAVRLAIGARRGSTTRARSPRRPAANSGWWAWPRARAAWRAMCATIIPTASSDSCRSRSARGDSGDVFGRAYVRWLEIQRSLTFVREQLAALPEGEVCRASAAGTLAPDHLAVALVEGWRGEICHVAVTDAAGRFACYKVVDPSFHNWFGLAMRDAQPADIRFPAVQQELQSVLLRARFVMETPLC